MPSDLRPTLLLTRPEPDSRRFAALLPEFSVVISPILRIVPAPHDAARVQSAPGLVFTSAHAVTFAGRGEGRLALCVGGRTASVARDAGFSVREGGGTAESLMPLIAAAEVPLLHPRGRHVAQELPVESVIIYDQIACPLSDDAQHLLAGAAPVILPLFSPRSARLLSAAMGRARAPLWIAAISRAARAGWTAQVIREAMAGAPTAEAVAAAIRRVVREEQS